MIALTYLQPTTFTESEPSRGWPAKSSAVRDAAVAPQPMPVSWVGKCKVIGYRV